jgi:hypothetical protein
VSILGTHDACSQTGRNRYAMEKIFMLPQSDEVSSNGPGTVPILDIVHNDKGQMSKTDTSYRKGNGSAEIGPLKYEHTLSVTIQGC